jgi:hypothetical protein
MPSQQRLGLHEESPPVILRQEPTQPGEQRSIIGLQERAAHLAAQHGLVAKHHDLDGEVVAFCATEPEHLEDADERHIEERQGYSEVSPPSRHP